jgi:predicted DNA-binding antitoxin AbrB/MazE fold protein
MFVREGDDHRREGRHEDGVFKPKEPVQLEEKTEVEVLIPTEAKPNEQDATGWKAIDELRGIVKGAPRDVSGSHDRYLYGDPPE